MSDDSEINKMFCDRCEKRLDNLSQEIDVLNTRMDKFEEELKELKTPQKGVPTIHPIQYKGEK